MPKDVLVHPSNIDLAILNDDDDEIVQDVEVDEDELAALQTDIFIAHATTTAKDKTLYDVALQQLSDDNESTS